MKEKKTLVILDAHALIHRSYHALPSFVSPSGEPMGAVYGVSAVLLKLIRELAPTHIAAAFDREEPTFRHVAYEAYKATRAETKNDLVPQFEKVKKIFEAFGIPIFEVAGFEADDLIGTLVERFKNENDLSIIIASGDMDTLQLVEGRRVRVYTLRKGIDDTIVYDQKQVEERFGFGPEHIPDFKGLKGDPSDNIIGVRGIGDKTATELILHYGAIEEMYTKLKKEKKHPGWLKERILTLLLESEEEALFSKELAKIRRDAPVAPSLADLAFRGVPKDEVARMFRTFHFPSLVARLEELGGEAPKKISVGRPFDPEAAKILGKAPRLVAFLEEGNLSIGSEDELFVLGKESAPEEKKHAAELLSTREVVAHNAKEIFHFLGEIFPITLDTALGAWLLAPDERVFDLAGLLPGKKPKEQELAELERELRARLAKENLATIYFDFELPLVPILARMENTGVLVDIKKLKELERKATDERAHLEKEICELAGEEFDVSSPKQLGRILFEVLKLSPKGIKKTSTKSISTQFSELVKLRGAHPIIDLLIRYREVAKLSSTYSSVLPTLADENGRIHTTFNQMGTATGRLSSNSPNLQNIPIRTALGQDVRRAFVASPGYELVSFDYSQLELRIAASLSGDKNLSDAFRNGDDVHTKTASVIFHVPAEAVTKEMRRRAKTINFGILYGMGARALAAGMGVPQGEAEKYLEEYLKDFPGIERYRREVVEEGCQKGYVETLFGRKRFLPNLRSQFPYVRSEAERMATNAPIQGTEADILKKAMIDIDREFNLETNTDIRMLLQVHDELLFEIKKEKVPAAAARIRAIMEHVPEITVPIVVDPKSGPNWQDMKPA